MLDVVVFPPDGEVYYVLLGVPTMRRMTTSGNQYLECDYYV